MLVFLWVAEIVLALLYLGLGVMRLVQPYDKLVRVLRWPADFPAWAVKLIGLAEILGALGLIIPAAADVAPILTPIAACALGMLMAGAVAVHLRRRERQRVALPCILLAMNVFIAIGRFGPYPG
ncbi:MULTISPECIES: DoxX family protein [Arthrobacter]|uniref:DoxX family protein n=1 Tax=Arthrobacter caoxuetaonis TaxID=2886935 RepID=A0A9X1SGM7_9MICC|nr:MULTISPECIES: DoxX family protein [Arthrobacter]MCC3284141.1 DoxX family protein [Arthrobacter caoxuetaonis]MCC3299534.1 DoxX family protein [Arthrobacter caoxuetaonis]MCC9194594.1 DoxX family protein [Arthrobacter sp. zg-Y916]USQ57784.1 DoxX family protein [Arthrobacter caoxuetaonis]